MNEYRRILYDLTRSKQTAVAEGDLIKLAYLNDIQIWNNITL